ncbi:MAG: hypothetical protein JXR76_11830 [Deltaproteobacteria bacterium]|nr:hypothetical protein [Deltaproteobacteria bacterium]
MVVDAAGDDLQQKLERGSFFPSYQSEIADAERRISVDLADTLKKIPNIIDAKVHLSLAEMGIWKPAQRRSRASVILWSANPAQINKNEIQSLVSGASSQLEQKDVHVFVYRLDTQSALMSDVPENNAMTVVSGRSVSDWKHYLVPFVVFILLVAIGILTIGIRRYVRRRELMRDVSLSSAVAMTEFENESKHTQ